MTATAMVCASVLAATTIAFGMPAAAQGGIGKYDYWRLDACGQDPRAACDAAFRRLCGKAPNAACVNRNRRTFSATNR